MWWCWCLPMAAQATMSRRTNVPPFGVMVKRLACLPACWTLWHNSKCVLIQTDITSDLDTDLRSFQQFSFCYSRKFSWAGRDLVIRSLVVMEPVSVRATSSFLAILPPLRICDHTSPSYHLCYSSCGRLHGLWRITRNDKQVW